MRRELAGLRAARIRPMSVVQVAVAAAGVLFLAACAPVDASDAGLTAPAPSITATPTTAPDHGCADHGCADHHRADHGADDGRADDGRADGRVGGATAEAEAEADTEAGAEACAEAEPGAEAGPGTVHMRPELRRPVPEGRHRGLRLLQRKRQRAQLCLRHRAGRRQRSVRS